MGRIRRWVVAAALVGGAAGCMDDARCTRDYDCPSTEVCNVDTGACEPLRCEVDDDCPQPGDRCQENVCISGG